MLGSNSNKQRAISAGNSGYNRGCLIVFGAIFALAGGAVMHFFFIVPTMRWAMAQSWEQVDCTITESYVSEHRSDDGYTYKANVHYTYEYEGRTYHGDRYNFFDGSSSGQMPKQQIVNQYRVGTVHPCFVNPKSPEESVINIEFQWDYLLGIFGGIFLGVGLWIMSGRLPGTGNKRTTWRDVAAKQYGVSADMLDLAPSESATLKPASSPMVKLIGITIFAGIWNGVTALIITAVWSEGFGAPWIILLIFGSIGVLLLLLVPYQILAMLNPRPELTITPGLIPLGGEAQLEWHFSGGTQRLHNLLIELVGAEEATYQQGTDTRTTRSIFFKQEIAATDSAVDVADGRVIFSIPVDMMHTFESTNNKIKWHIRVKSDIPMWPDIDEEFPVVVRPLNQQEREMLRHALHTIGE